MAGNFSYKDPLYSQAPEDDRDGPNANLYALRRALATMMDCSLPVTVLDYDRANNVVTVQPLILKMDTQNNLYERKEIYNVQALSIGAGGIHINFPIKKGDLGWVIAADRDLDLFKQYLDSSKPNTQRAHTFADSWFVPDTFRKYTISQEDSDSAVIQSTDGNSKISINHDRIILAVGGTKITITDGSITTNTGSNTINATTSHNGNVSVDGNISATGNVSAGGSMSATAGGTFAGHTVQSHYHVDSTGHNTGGPVN